MKNYSYWEKKSLDDNEEEREWVKEIEKKRKKDKSY